MRTIEVFFLRGDNRQLLARMHFLNDKDFQEMASRVVGAAPCNSLRYDRQELGLIRIIYQSGRESEYYADPITNKLLNICTVYAIVYGHAKRIAQDRGWLFAWKYSSPEWQHKATLRKMRRAQRLLLKD